MKEHLLVQAEATNLYDDKVEQAAREEYEAKLVELVAVKQQFKEKYDIDYGNYTPRPNFDQSFWANDENFTEENLHATVFYYLGETPKMDRSFVS